MAEKIEKYEKKQKIDFFLDNLEGGKSVNLITFTVKSEKSKNLAPGLTFHGLSNQLVNFIK